MTKHEDVIIIVPNAQVSLNEKVSKNDKVYFQITVELPTKNGLKQIGNIFLDEIEYLGIVTLVERNKK